MHFPSQVGLPAWMPARTFSARHARAMHLNPRFLRSPASCSCAPTLRGTLADQLPEAAAHTSVRALQCVCTLGKVLLPCHLQHVTGSEKNFRSLGVGQKSDTINNRFAWAVSVPARLHPVSGFTSRGSHLSWAQGVLARRECPPVFPVRPAMRDCWWKRHAEFAPRLFGRRCISSGVIRPSPFLSARMNWERARPPNSSGVMAPSIFQSP